MWDWSLNWGEISPHIVVGSCPMTPADIGRIQSGAGVSALLSLQHDDCLAYWGIDYDAMRREGSRLGLAMRRCPVRDFDIPHQRACLPYAVAALAGLRAAGHRIYVHCTAGLGRAPLAVLGYLTWVAGQSPDGAIRQIHAARPGAVPAWEAYCGCREDLVARHRSSIARQAYELYENDRSRSALEHWVAAEAQVIHSVLSELGCETGL
jgi:Polymorphic toxin system, DSP-PTPase phosphatase